MLRRIDVALGVALALAFVVGCSKAKTESVVVGHHRVQFVLPKDWEHLDHGSQQLFRLGENQISMVDLGPATREAMVAELQAADSLWRVGRRRDMFQRIRELKSPMLRYASHEQRASFWKPWTDVTYIPDIADSLAIGGALQELIAGVGRFEDATPARMSEYVLFMITGTKRREVGHEDRRTIHGADWVDVELWDPVSHMNRSRVAYLVNHAYLLVMETDHGLYETSAPAFEALLTSVEVTAGPPGAR